MRLAVRAAASPCHAGFDRTSDGEPMEAEWRGSIPVGTRLLSVDGVDTEMMSPQEVSV